MIQEFIAAGSGGQGVLLIGQIIAYSAICKGMEASWIPSYGPEMRGGTANCSFIIADEEIGSPVVETPNILFSMNQPSMDKFGSTVQDNGLIIVNSSLVTKIQKKALVKVVEVPTAEIAIELRSTKVENMVMLGAFLGVNPIITIDEAINALTAKLGNKPKVIELNRKAMEKGAECVKKYLG
jgi:2-oxoglutarate ferredoxin oxidoreductase subunit gamma